jgi:hypothetical protein
MGRWVSVFVSFLLMVFAVGTTSGEMLANDLDEEMADFSEEIDKLQKRVVDWCIDNGQGEVAQQVANDLADILVLRAEVDEKFHHQLRQNLLRHRRRLDAIKRKLQGVERINERITAIAKALRIEPLEGDYKWKRRGLPPRTYRLKRNDDGSFSVMNVTIGQNVKQQLGKIEWHAENAEWRGNLDSIFLNDPVRALRRGDLVLVPVHPKLLLGEQTYYRWDGKGKTKAMVMGGGVIWEWWEPLP